MACTGIGICPQDQEGCIFCGCDWDFEYNQCDGTASPCSWHDNEFDCDRCSCTWVVTNIKINIGDIWKDASEIKINIGDVWKPVVEIWQNIGDVWKRVF